MKSGMAYLANSRSDLLHGAFQQVSYQIESSNRGCKLHRHALNVPRLNEVHIFLGFFLGDDGQRMECIEVSLVPIVVVIVKMRIEQIAHGFVSPLANLCDVFTRLGRQEAAINYEDLSFTDDDGSVTAWRPAPMFNLIHAFSQLCYVAALLRRQRSSGKEEDEGGGDSKQPG